MNDIQTLKSYIGLLRNFLKKGSIMENESKIIEYYLTYSYSFITNLTFKTKLKKFKRVTVNSRVSDGGKQESLTRIDQLVYNREGAKLYGRANMIGDKILYGTDDIPTALMEARVVKDDLITVSTWKLKEGFDVCVAPIFKNFPSKSEIINIDFFNLHCVYWKTIRKIYSPEDQIIVNEFVQFLADCFTKDVDETNHYDYFLSAFFSARLLNNLDNGSIDALMYPSMRNDLITTNLAFKQASFDEKYELELVEEKIVRQQPIGINKYCELKPLKKTCISLITHIFVYLLDK
jgi:hypothetical protein